MFELLQEWLVHEAGGDVRFGELRRVLLQGCGDLHEVLRRRGRLREVLQEILSARALSSDPYFSPPDRFNRVRFFILAGLLGGGLERVKTRATAEGLVKGGAEMAQAVVTHFQRDFGDVVLPGFQ